MNPRLSLRSRYRQTGRSRTGHQPPPGERPGRIRNRIRRARRRRSGNGFCCQKGRQASPVLRGSTSVSACHRPGKRERLTIIVGVKAGCARSLMSSRMITGSNQQDRLEFVKCADVASTSQSGPKSRETCLFRAAATMKLGRNRSRVLSTLARRWLLTRS